MGSWLSWSHHMVIKVMNVLISYPNNQTRGRMNFDRSFFLLQVAGGIKGVDILFAEPMICVSGVHGTLCPPMPLLHTLSLWHVFICNFVGSRDKVKSPNNTL